MNEERTPANADPEPDAVPVPAPPYEEEPSTTGVLIEGEPDEPADESDRGADD